MQSLSEFIICSQIQDVDLKDSDLFLVEGLNIDPYKNEISLTMDHQDGVDFTKESNPIYDELSNGQKTISIFKRTKLKDIEGKQQDGNPFIYALKEKFGWKIKMTDKEISQYLRRFVDICSELKDNKFDTIICTPSSSKLNKRFAKALMSILKINNYIEEFFQKIEKVDILGECLDREAMIKDFGEDKYDNEVRRLALALRKMKGKYFEAKHCPKDLLKYIKYIDLKDDSLSYRDKIDGKNVVIIDDIISSGNTLEQCGDGLVTSFNPESLTVVTLLSRVK